jgi:hypothetical protein
MRLMLRIKKNTATAITQTKLMEINAAGLRPKVGSR